MRGHKAVDVVGDKEPEGDSSDALLEKLARLIPGVIYQYRLYPDGSSAFPWSSPGMSMIYEVTPEEDVPMWSHGVAVDSAGRGKPRPFGQRRV